MPDVPDEVWAEVDADMEADKRAMDRPLFGQKPNTRKNRRCLLSGALEGCRVP